MTKRIALAGNRTRVTRVAGEYSTSRPPVPYKGFLKSSYDDIMLHLIEIKKLLNNNNERNLFTKPSKKLSINLF